MTLAITESCNVYDDSLLLGGAAGDITGSTGGSSSTGAADSALGGGSHTSSVPSLDEAGLQDSGLNGNGSGGSEAGNVPNVEGAIGGNVEGRAGGDSGRGEDSGGGGMGGAIADGGFGGSAGASGRGGFDQDGAPGSGGVEGGTANPPGVDGGTGGDDGKGGSSGAGGAAAALWMIDDMESSKLTIDRRDSRIGYYYVDGDAAHPKTSLVMERVTNGAPGRSTYAMHFGWNSLTIGDPDNRWGAMLGFYLVDSEAGKRSYDASLYTGITFHVRLGPACQESGASCQETLKLAVSDVYTAPEGGLCVPDPGEYECNDDYYAEVSVSAEWRRITLKWEALRTGGWGNVGPKGYPESNKLYAIKFRTVPRVGQFDFLIDDIAFCTPTTCSFP